METTFNIDIQLRRVFSPSFLLFEIVVCRNALKAKQFLRDRINAFCDELTVVLTPLGLCRIHKTE